MSSQIRFAMLHDHWPDSIHAKCKCATCMPIKQRSSTHETSTPVCSDRTRKIKMPLGCQWRRRSSCCPVARAAGAGQSVGPTGQPDMSALDPQLAPGCRPWIGCESPQASTGFEPRSLDSEPRVLAVTTQCKLHELQSCCHGCCCRCSRCRCRC
jgi:hypothetical protein